MNEVEQRTTQHGQPLSPKEAEIYHVLERGGKYGAMDFVRLCNTTKALTRICEMRKRGIVINDEWRVAANGRTRYKVYFLPQYK